MTRSVLPAEYFTGMEPCELWEPIPWAPGYEVSSWGRVRCGAQLVAVWENAKDYVNVTLVTPDGPRLVYVHELVLEAFIEPRPTGYQADHLDGDRRRNVLLNLEWVTPEENVRRARERRRRAIERATGQRNLLDFVA